MTLDVFDGSRHASYTAITHFSKRQIVTMEEPQRIRQFNELPSAEEFASRIESTNIPAVFSGCVKDWKAFSKWNVLSGGLDYLQEFVGLSVVGAMLSSSAPVFYGDIRSHERVPLPFSTFIRYCKDLLQGGDGTRGFNYPLSKHKPVEHIAQHGDHITEEDCSQQIYLAQVPIMNAENEEKAQLECLREDIKIPAFLEGKILVSINLWMNNAKTRSSIHYDPHHNLLCIISGCKQVVLYSPEACPFLYPLPLYGEASNHSAVPLDNTNFSLYPRATLIDKYSQKVILNAGDALFIPEGWFHQVDSEDLTIAVNFWWQSDIMSSMSEHMDAYYLRRIVKRLTDKEMDRMLGKPSYTVDKKNIAVCSHPNGNAGHHNENLDQNHRIATAKENEQGFPLHELQPHPLKSLHELVSLVHNCVNQNQSVSNISANQSLGCPDEEDGVKGVNKTNVNLEEDAIAKVIWNLDACTFLSVFLAMAHNFPRTLDALVMHALSSVGAEVLTRKFEQMDQVISEDDRSRFFQKFYSVFDNQLTAMDTLLNGKESFACQAFNNVLVQYLGNNRPTREPSRE